MSNNPDLAPTGSKTIDKVEHRYVNNVGAKAVIPYLYDGTNMVPTTSDQAALRVDNTSTASAIYIGTAPIATATSAASWQIQKLDTSSGVVITWAAGASAFNQVWDNRTSLAYS